MRLIAIYFLLVIVKSSYGQIAKVEVADSTLLRAIDLTIDTLAIPKNELGVITLKITNLNVIESEVEVDDERHGKALKKVETLVYDIKSSFNMNELLLQFEPPSCYFFYRDRPILMYFGSERFIKVGADDIDNFRKKLKKYFRRDGGSYTSPTCWLKVNGDQIVLIRKWTVPWSAN